MITAIIPARNEPYLKKTIENLLSQAVGEIEVRVVLDGYWPDQFVEDKRVTYIHYSEPRGMRNAINACVATAQGEFILKTDAHCIFSKGFDKELSGYIKDNWIVIPRRYALDVKNWQIEKRTDNKYPIDVMKLSDELQGIPTTERKDNGFIETESFQGSCWFMHKDYFNKLGLMDEKKYGGFWQEAQEMAMKCKKDGGKVMRNTKAWYAHWHKTDGRGYALQEDKDKTKKAIKELHEK
jgi:glycosyltransferase involved in cell wall biosynthesis